MNGEDILKRAQRAFSDREWYESLWQDCYDYAMPSRRGFEAQTPGQDRMDKVFDETAIVALQEFASTMQQGMVPAFGKWFRFEPGILVGERQREVVQQQLDEVGDYVLEVLANSTFPQETHEMFQELGIGTGAMFVDESAGGIIFKSIPLTDFALRLSPFGWVEGIYRTRKLTARDAVQLWGERYTLPRSVREKVDGESPDAQPSVDFIEATERVYDEPMVESWRYTITEVSDKETFVDRTERGDGSGFWLTPRWTTASEEVYGRGPLMNALPAIKSCNLTMQLILENAEVAIEGIWQTDDDGTINVDTIKLLSGSIVPRMPGSRGLEQLVNNSKFDVGQLVLAEMRHNIRKALYNMEFGALDKTPLSATEVSLRESKLAELIGPAYGRIHSEFIQPLLMRVVYLLKRMGRIELPRIDGREVKVVAKTPMARAYRAQDITRLTNFVATVGNIVGPQGLPGHINLAGLVARLEGLYEIPRGIVLTQAQKAQANAGPQENPAGALAALANGLPALTP